MSSNVKPTTKLWQHLHRCSQGLSTSWWASWLDMLKQHRNTESGYKNIKPMTGALVRQFYAPVPAVLDMLIK